MTPIFEKSMSVLADLMACLLFLAMTIILRDWPTAQKVSSNSSLISPAAALKMIENINRKSQPTTIKKSSLFQRLFFRYGLKPAILTRAAKSMEIVTFSRSSTAIKNGESAILKPSTIVVTMRMPHDSRRPM